jgi:addiction module HigA family antidote
MLRIPTHRPPTTPGTMLSEEFLKPLNITISEFADRIGVTRARMSEIVHGRRRITPDTALRLEKALGMSAQFWLNAQMATDLYAALHNKHPAIDKIKPIDLARAG